MTSESLEEACERTGGSGSVGPGNLGREDNAMAVAGRRVPGRGSLLSVPVGDWDLRVPGLRVPRPRVAWGCRTILRLGTTCGSSPARLTPRLYRPAHPARPQASGPEAIRLSAAGGWRKPKELDRTV